MAVEIPKDRIRNRKREFCFVVFDTEQAANQACLYPKQYIGQRLCDVKKAQPQPICYQQKRLNQNASQDANQTNLNQTFGNENGSTTMPLYDTATRANENIAPTNTTPTLVAPMGAVLYYQAIALPRSNQIASRIVPVATRPIYAAYTAYPAIVAPTANFYATEVPSDEPLSVEDYYINYYSQTAAYYCQQQEQQSAESNTTTEAVERSKSSAATAAPKAKSSAVIIGEPTHNFPHSSLNKSRVFSH